jgi:predicted transcriptional regulator
VHCIAIETCKLKVKTGYQVWILLLIKYNLSNPQNTSLKRKPTRKIRTKTIDYNKTKRKSNLGKVTIGQVLSQVFRRPYLSVLPGTSFAELGTFLATGYQIYVDGLIVAADKRLVGRLSVKHILDHILRMNYHEWSRVTASELMDGRSSSVELDSTLDQLFRLFEETRFALAPVTKKGVLIGSIGIRDLLQVIVDLNLDAHVRTLGSPIISFSPDKTLKNAIELMLEKNIRNLLVPSSADDTYYFINDRKILEFIFSYNGRKIMEQGDGATALDSINVGHLDMIPVVSIPEETTISNAAAMLEDINTPGLVLKNIVITPWDVVMKSNHFDMYGSKD